MFVSPAGNPGTSYPATDTLRSDAGDDLLIGLVSLLPSAGLASAEAQFRTLLQRAAAGRRIELKLFTLTAADCRPSQSDAAGVQYVHIDALWGQCLDGLIVTGAEPQAEAMTDEPYWQLLTRLADWAALHTRSAIWSCFAAHAAVFHLDGIARRPLPEKLFGVYQCARSADTGFLTLPAAPWRVPHSRFNTLSEEALRGAGHLVLSSSERTGADIFTKRYRASQFLFFQGHPEYDSQALAAEHCRDIRRFMTGQIRKFPQAPEYYYEPHANTGFAELYRRGYAGGDSALLAEAVLLSTGTLPQDWSMPAQEIYGEWIRYLAAQKADRQMGECRSVAVE